ncbi:uncharacterized protein LOC143277972 isoform X3 [Babylonia areolata]|uniref:uncharacterized protein LOC143277972 isoform X3 n=1 Tax=Babylonia areolata TaxID=304850 RepID=UPI003FD45734
MSTALDETGTTQASGSTITTTTTTHALGSTLSVNAAEFVPSRRLSHSDGHHDGSQLGAGVGGGGGGSVNNPLAEVPRFLTTCYPFVNLASPQGLKVDVDSPGPVAGAGRGFRQATNAPFGAGNLQHPYQHIGMFPPQHMGYHHPSTTPPHANPHHLPWLTGLQPMAAFNPALSMAPLTPGVHIPFDGGTPPMTATAGLGGNGAGGLLPVPKQDGLLPTPTFRPPMNGPHVLGGPPTVPGVMMPCPSPAATPVCVPPTPHDRKGSSSAGGGGARGQGGRSHSASVSRGTQKETSSLPSGVRAHTIIMKDSSIQTDFNNDFANLTLQEKPSVLYRRGQRRNKGNRPITSTDSEEVDSDSGYSSPLHRRNLVSNGTHPVQGATLDEERELDKTTGEKGKKATVPAAAGCDQHAKGSSKGDGMAALAGKNSSSSTLRKAAKGSAGSVGMTGLREMPSAPSSSPSVEQKDPIRASPMLPGLDGKGVAQAAAAAAGKEKERARTPVKPIEAPRSESESGSVLAPPRETAAVVATNSRTIGGSAVRMAPLPPATAGAPSSTSSSSKEPSAAKQQPYSPGSSRRSVAPSPAFPDFPILKPAKRNEPPWSLTPNANKGKKVDGGGFMGMVADSVKSYASIVKSLSSPSKAQPSVPCVGGGVGVGAAVAGGSGGGVGPSQTTGSAGGAWTLLQPQLGGDCREMHSADDGWVRLQPVGLEHVPALAGQEPDPPPAGVKVGKLYSQAARPAAAAGGSTSVPSQQGSGRKGGPIWVGEEGTVLKGKKTENPRGRAGAGGSADSDPFCPSVTTPQPEGGNMGSSSIGGSQHSTAGPLQQQQQQHRDISKQHCDNRTNYLSIVEGGPPSSSHVADSPSSPDAAQKTGAAHSLSPGFATRLSRSSDRASDKEGGGDRTDSAHRRSALSGDEKTDEEEGKKKRRRQRRRRRRGKSQSGEGGGGGGGLSDGMSGMERTVSSSNISRSSDVTLHFEDEDEFPEVGAASGNEGGGGAHSILSSNDGRGRSPVGGDPEVALLPHNMPFRKPDPLAWISYSDVLKRKPSVNDVRSRTQSAPGSCLSGEEGGDENFSSQPGQGSMEQTPLSKKARKRRKRRELANRAAEAELAEITLEQQMLRHKVTSSQGSRPGSGSREERSPARGGLITDQAVVKQAKGAGSGGQAPSSSSSSGKRLHQPISLSIADMLDAFEKKKSVDQKAIGVLGGVAKKALLPSTDKKTVSGNLLDGNAPAKRGKERETPKPKKPSPLKKIILKEREEKKRMRLMGGEVDVYSGVDLPDNPDPDTDPEGANPAGEDDDLEDGNTGNPVGLGESDLSQDGLSSRSLDTDQGVSPGADLSPISQTSPLSMSPLTPGASPISSPIAGYLSRDPVVLRIHSRRFREYCTQILDKDIDMCCTALLHELVRFQDRVYHKDPNKAKGKRRVVLGLREVTKHLKLKKIKCVIISPNLEKIQSKGGLDEALNNILNMCQEQNVPFVFALGRRALGRACAKLVPVSVAGIFNYEGCEEKFNQLISLTHKGREAYADMVRAVEREIAENPPPPSMSGVSSVVPSLYAHMGHSRTPSGCSAISFTSSVLSEPISENYPHAEPETDSKGYEIVRDEDGNVISTPRASYQNGGGSGAGGALQAYQPSVEDFDEGNEADTEDINDVPLRKKASSSGGGVGGRRGDDSGGSSKGRQSECTDSEEFFDAVDDIPSLANHVGEAVSYPSPAPHLHHHHHHHHQQQQHPDTTNTTTLGTAAAEEALEAPPSEEGDSNSEIDSQHWNSGSVVAVGNSYHHPHPHHQHPSSPPPQPPPPLHIDSIHSSQYDLGTEILSQHSSRTLDNSEALSTHSSRTLGEGSLTPSAEPGRPHTPDSLGRPPRGGGVSAGGRLMNKERVQSWVENCLQEEKGSEEDDDDDDEGCDLSDPDSEQGVVGGGVGDVSSSSSPAPASALTQSSVCD